MVAAGHPLSKTVAFEAGGRRIDRFELVAELATGGMATVYLARLSGVGGFQRFVAIKSLHPHLAREPEFIQMFLDEARLAARIHHRNVVPILEIGASDQLFYIVMEYVEGDTLGRLMARAALAGERLPVQVGVRIVLDVLAGLDAAHELQDDDNQPLGIVHRDVSPQNVLVGVDGSARLSDFGVARATSRLSTTRTGQLKGKLEYMAPEQARSAKDMDRRADIFAAGAVLWEVVTSQRLFKGEGEADTLNKVLNEPLPSLRSAEPSAPGEIEEVVAKALDRDRDRRYATASEFADALERAARMAGVLGTHKDVAAHLDAVLGTEINLQRDAVRGWISRCEPSVRGLPKPPAASSASRLDGYASRGEDTPSGNSTFAAAATTGRLPVVSRSPVPPAPAALPRAHLWPWAIVVLLVAAGAGVWTRTRARAPAVPTAPSASARIPSTSVSPPPASPPSANSAAAVPSEEPAAPSRPAGTASTAVPLVSPSRPLRAPRQSEAAAAPSRTPTAATAPVPDDISRNPYR